MRNRYIVLPNVGEGGKFTLLRAGLAPKYVEMPCVGGYVDGDLGKLGVGNLNILAGKAKEWGNKAIACFQTSDNRYADHRDLGRSSTWIKWAAPTAEGLRQACLASASRVSQVVPPLPSLVVRKLTVTNSVFLGPVDLGLNPQYSALIGGRGTGKSTILEYLRWGLCDQPPRGDAEDTPNYEGRRARLIELTLKPVSGKVQVDFELNGVRHAVRRDSADGSVSIKIGQDEPRVCTEDEVRGLLPIQAYSQKQLSDVSVRIEELSRFVMAPIRGQLEQLERQTADRADRVRASYTKRLRQRTLTRLLNKRELEGKSLADQADSLRAGLTGLSEDDRALLEQGKGYDAANRAVQSWQDGVKTLREGLSAIATTVGSLLQRGESVPELPTDALRLAADEYRKLLADTKETLERALERADQLGVAMAAPDGDNPWRRWATSLAEFRSAYSAAVERSSAHRERLSELQSLEARLSEHDRETARVREDLDELVAADAAYEEDRESWLNLLAARGDALSAECARLTQRSGGSIRAQIKREADATDIVMRMRQALSGSRVPGAKIERLGDFIVGSDGDAVSRWTAILTDLEQLAEFDPAREGAERRPETPALVSAGLSSSDLDRVAAGLTPEDWLNVSLTPITSTPVFEFRAAESEYIPFRNASAGQQATALLKTLLNQQGPPLVIDQPEEDLDNPVMLEVVEQVWAAKRRRQLIFASHNANLVVNGDAELVAWCDYRTAGDQSRGTIAGEGAIDIPDVRDAIKAIMEGGEAAFNLRREKYGF